MRKSTAILGAVLLAAAASAAAQNADTNTAGPTANQLQLRLVEPAQGATITGSQVRISLSYSRTMFGQGQGTRFGEPNFPHPIFDVYLDNELKHTLKGGEANVATIENVPAGDHKIVVMAKNISGEVIDRKEVAIRTVAAASEAPLTERTTERTAESQPISAPSEPMETETGSTLPATGSSFPRAALLGLTLIATGLLLGRKAR